MTEEYIYILSFLHKGKGNTPICESGNCVLSTSECPKSLNGKFALQGKREGEVFPRSSVCVFRYFKMPYPKTDIGKYPRRRETSCARLQPLQNQECDQREISIWVVEVVQKVRWSLLGKHRKNPNIIAKP